MGKAATLLLAMGVSCFHQELKILIIYHYIFLAQM
jgi:hypothetical protein